MSSTCCNCCGATSLIGVVFFGITATMVQRQNAVFLSHKAGLDLHTLTDEDLNTKFMAMIYMIAVFAGAMLFCFTTGCLLQKREVRKQADEEFVRAHNAKVAFSADEPITQQ